MTTLSAIVTCHAAQPDAILACLAGQTRAADEILLGWSEAPHGASNITGVTRVEEADDEKDFGYGKRQRLASQAKSEWLGFFCHDDSYHPRYVELMMAFGDVRREGPSNSAELDVVWCPWNDRPGCSFRPCDSTLGNFIVRRETFMKAKGFAEFGVGAQLVDPWGRVFNGPNHGLRDAAFIKRVRAQTSRIEKVSTLLYYHNVPFDESVKATSWGQPCQSAKYADMLSYTNRQLEAKDAQSTIEGNEEATESA